MRCTCGGTAPGYPQHEDSCMLVTGVDPDIETAEAEDYWRALLADEPAVAA